MAERVFPDRKKAYVAKLRKYIEEYKTCIIVGADNVGSNQLQQIRKAIRGKGVVVMGKNTMARYVIRESLAQQPELEKLLPWVKENIGFVFTNDDTKAVRDTVLSFKVPAVAKAGTFAPVDVIIPAGPTSLDPGQTTFFQALNISTKIFKGAIEIVSDVHLIRAGDKVDQSQVALLAKLNRKPFSYGLSCRQIYDAGALYAPEVLDITQDILNAKFFKGLNYVAALSLALNYPAAASVPHLIRSGFSKLLALSVATDYTFEQSKKIKDILSDPEAFAKAQAAAKVASPSKKAASPSKKASPAKKVEEEEEEEDVGGGFSMFGDDDE